MSSQSRNELQEIMSYIIGGDSRHDQLRSALGNFPTSLQGEPLFACAIQHKNMIALKLLTDNFGQDTLSKKPQVNAKPADSLLHIAVDNYDERVWNFVLQQIDLERVFDHLGITGKNHTTILHAAANRNIAVVFRGLHGKMGDVLRSKLLRTRDHQQQTVLHVAASRSNIECYDTVVELLKIEPKLIRAQDRNGETVFHKVVAANQKRVLQYLLTVESATVRKCDKQNQSPYGLFLKKRAQSGRIQAKKNAESFEGLARINSFDDEIGSILHKAILDLNVNISEMRQLLFKDEPGGIGPELIWDLSTFDDQRMNFTAYLRVLESNKFKIKFFETLKRVTLPDLSCNKNHSCDATNHGLRKSFEANIILNHLESKGVNHIIEVVVPDCMVHPHANRHISSALRPFNVRRLKWRKLDLGVKTIAMAAPEVEELTLYSRGDRDALFQWVDVDGLCQLPKLHTIHITIFRGEEDDAELETIRRQCEEALLGHKYHSQPDCTLTFIRDNSLWKAAQLTCGCQKPRFTNSQITVELEPGPTSVQGLDQQLNRYQHHVRQGTIFDKLLPLRQFITSLNGPKAEPRVDRDYLKENPVRVAVLDSGIYADSDLFPDLTGASFIEDITTTDSHWHTASNPHGFIMASLIRKLDPTCRIFAARTHNGPDMQGGHIGAAIKALEWAVKQEADIILMSWTCAGDVVEHDVGELETKIQEAARNSLIFCTTGDKGPSAKQSYPAGFTTPFKISSCSISGEPSTNAEKNNTEFYLSAENLDVVVPEYLNIGEKRPADGSSAATALAAGLATLILTLARFAYYKLEDRSSESEAGGSDNEAWSEGSELYSPRITPLQAQRADDQVVQLKKRSMMERVFRYMCCSSDRFVQPWEVFPMDLIDKDLGSAKEAVVDFLNRASRL